GNLTCRLQKVPVSTASAQAMAERQHSELCRGRMMSYLADSLTRVVNAYYHMRLSVSLTSEMTPADVAELRWQLGLGPQPLDSGDLPAHVSLFLRERAFHREDPDLAVDLTARAGGGWLLSAWQEPAPEDLDRLEPLFVWLARRADAAEIASDGSVHLGDLRFYDEQEWTHRILVYRNRVFYPRIDRRRPARELMPNGDAAVTTWDDLTARLALTLAHMREGDWMTLSGPESGYAQFSISDQGEVYGEISSNNFLPEAHRMSPTAEAAMRQLGWQEPDEMNWYWELPKTATAEQHHRLAHAAVSALRDVLKIAEPQQLSLAAESQNVGEGVDVSAMGIKL
ncbi:TY-Chap domain-containing protein, partial [Nocardia sp. R16R-3T]